MSENAKILDWALEALRVRMGNLEIDLAAVNTRWADDIASVEAEAELIRDDVRALRRLHDRILWVGGVFGTLATTAMTTAVAMLVGRVL